MDFDFIEDSPSARGHARAWVGPIKTWWGGWVELNLTLRIQ